MNDGLATQYDKIVDSYRSGYDKTNGNQFNREIFHCYIEKLGLNNQTKVLDLGCGSGEDLNFCKGLGADIYGIDASTEMLGTACKNLNLSLDKELKHASFDERIPFEDSVFDFVISKYAIQTSHTLEFIFTEMCRVLKQGGVMLYLSKHPFRQFFERKENEPDYFKQKVVESHIFQESVTIREPTHTMTEYLSPFLFKKFDVQAYNELWEPAAEIIGNARYPGFLIIQAKKR